MKLRLKKSIVFCLICTMLLGMMGMDASAADITYIYDDAGTMQSYVNSFRQSGEGWYYDQNNQKVAGQVLSPLSYDYNLENLAMKRAAELVSSYGHRDISAEMAALGMTCWGENIAWGESYLGTADSIFTAWREEKEMYDGQGHRRNMLSVGIPYTSIGVGHVRANGVDYWVQIFGSGNGGGSRVDLNGSTSTPPAEQQPEVPKYNVIEGTDTVWVKSSGAPLVVKIDADAANFSGVVINGVVVDPSNYEVTSGSTIITFKPEYMNLLDAGYYTIRVNYKDGGYAEIPFSVDTTTSTETNASNSQNNTTGTQNTTTTTTTTTTTNNTRSPQTGDSTSGMIVVFLMLAAVSGVAVCQISRKKVR